MIINVGASILLRVFQMHFNIESRVNKHSNTKRFVRKDVLHKYLFTDIFNLTTYSNNAYFTIILF